MDRVIENVIEWLEGDEIAKCTFSQKKFINRIKRMAEKPGSPVEIVTKNMDGSICARIPLSAVHLYLSSWNGSGLPAKGEEDETHT